MIQFIHKKHAHLNPKTAKLIIYYSFSDLVLGLLLIVLVAFFIYNYLVMSLSPAKSGVVISPSYQGQLRAK